MVSMHFSQQFCRPSNTDSANHVALQTVQNHITLKMRVVENIFQYIYYAFSRTLTKIVGDVVAFGRYSAPGTQMSPLKFYRIKGIVDVSVNINRSLLKL